MPAKRATDGEWTKENAGSAGRVQRAAQHERSYDATTGAICAVNRAGTSSATRGAMQKVLAFSLLASLVATGCSSVIPAQDFDAIVEVDGVTTRTILAFPERDPKAAHNAGEPSCSWASGYCGADASTVAEIRGADTRIWIASYATVSTGEAAIYDIGIKRTPDDEAAYRALVDAKGSGYDPGRSGILCRLYDEEIGTKQQCFYSTSSAFITLVRR
jgi:hypothetical protein